MKRLIFCGVIVALLSACSEQQTMETELEQGIEQLAEGYISPAQAVEIANNFAADFKDEAESRSVTRHASSTRSVMTIGPRHSQSRSTEDLIYVVNYDDNQGFALVSKHKNATPVLAFIPEGNYNQTSADKIGGFQDFLEHANAYVYQSINGEYSITLPPGGGIIDTIPHKIDTMTPAFRDQNYAHHFIHLDWEQEGVFAKYCSNGYAGCGPLSFAMVCAHYEKPEKIKITFDRSNREITLDWKTIKEHAQENSGVSTRFFTNPDTDLWPDCKYTSCTKESHDQLALLLRQLGHELGASYKEGGTGIGTFAMYYYICTKFIDFDMTAFASFNNYTVKTAIKKEQPVIFAGIMPGGGGHIWICDGYLSQDCNNDGAEEEYFYYNWGYGGEFNGLFLSGVFHLKEGWSDITEVTHSVIALHK